MPSTTSILYRHTHSNNAGSKYIFLIALYFNVKIIRGTVPDTLINVDSNKICYLSIDMNCVEPEVASLEFFWDKMVSGGLIIFDDYGYANMCNDQKMAHDMFAESKGVKILTLPTCQGLLIKP